MNCKKCSGLMVADHDPESPTGIRCINCGSQGVGSMSTDKQTEECAKTACPDPKADDSVYCPRHREMKRAANQKALAKKKGLPAAPKTIGDVVRKMKSREKTQPAVKTATGPIAEIDAAIARRMEEIKTLEAAKTLLVGVV